MAPLIKVKVINTVNGQFGQQLNQNWPYWSTKQNNTEQCNYRQASTLFFTVAQLEGELVEVQGHIGSYDSILYYL